MLLYFIFIDITKKLFYNLIKFKKGGRDASSPRRMRYIQYK